MNVHQVLSGAGPRDAVTGEALAFRVQFRRWGWGGRDYAARIAPGLNGAISASRWFRAAPEDVLLIHHSAGASGLRDLLAAPNPKLVHYHNVTPAEWLWNEDPLMAAYCELGRAQLPDLVDATDVATAVSQFSASELRALGARQTFVVPPLIDRNRLGALSATPATVDPSAPTVLGVGRLSPHKRQDDAIRAFALYRRHHAPGARLILVGDPISPGYGERLQSLADTVAPGAVSFETALSDAELGERYRGAHAFLCLSAHEGFCIPLLEAMQFRVPVIARPAGAVGEVVGDAGLLVPDNDDLAVIAELLDLVVTDAELRGELTRRGQDRLERYSLPTVSGLLRQAVEATVDAAKQR